MKNTVAVFVCCVSLLVAGHGKTKTRDVLVPDVQGKQDKIPTPDKDDDPALLVREAGNAFIISAGMVPSHADTARLVLKVRNASSVPRRFSPDQIIILLPNGHSYHPFSRVDMLAQAHEVNSDDDRGEKKVSKPVMLKETGVRTTCSVEGEIAECSTTPDVSMEAWRARRQALTALVSSALDHRKFKSYRRELEELYLAPRDIGPGDIITGYVDVYVEDSHAGPFTVRVPAGNTTWFAPAPGKLAVPKSTYDFRFGPEVVALPR